MKHIIYIMTLLFMLASNCQAMCGRAPIIFRNEPNTEFAANTLFFFTGDIPSWHGLCFETDLPFDEICNKIRNFFTDNYIEDENGNRIVLKYISFNEINSDNIENNELSEIFAFSIEQVLEENTKYKARFVFDFYPSEKEAFKTYEVPKGIDTLAELSTFYEQREPRYIDSLVFVTSTEKLKAPTDKIKIISIEKQYDERRHVICPAGPEIIHTFTMDAEPKNPFCMLKISHKNTSVVDKILVRINQDNKIVLFDGPCGKNYYFQPGDAYSIQAASVNTAGQIGSYSEEFHFKAAKPPFVFRRMYDLFMWYVNGIYEEYQHFKSNK